MYAGVTNNQVVPGKIDEAVAVYRDYIVATAREHHGIRDLLLLVDRNTGKFTSIGLWETEADARAYESSGAFQDAVAKFAGLFEKPTVREVYEVAVHAKM